MNFQKFVVQLPGDLKQRRSEETLKIWHVIHKRVSTEGQTSRYDVGLIDAVRKVKFLTGEGLQRHLRILQQAGIIQGIKMARQTTPMESAMGLGGLFREIMGFQGPPPGAFTAYTFPGMRVDAEGLAKQFKRKPRERSPEETQN